MSQQDQDKELEKLLEQADEAGIQDLMDLYYMAQKVYFGSIGDFASQNPIYVSDSTS